MYLNDVPLGQRGSFAIFGVAEASRLFFGKDVSNVSLAEAATIAGVIQSPSALSPFNNPERCQDRRNVVLQAMADAGYITQDAADARRAGAARRRAARARSRGAVLRRLRRPDARPSTIPGLTTTTNQAVDVYTTLDLHLQRLAQDAVRDGLTQRRRAAVAAQAQGQGRGGAHRRRSAHRRDPRVRRRPLVQPVAVQPRDRRRAGSRARSSSRSSTSTAFEQAADEGPHRRHAGDASSTTSRRRSSSTIRCGRRRTTRTSTTARSRCRRALAHSRNLATIHVAQAAGYDRVARSGRSSASATPPKAVSVDRARRLRSDAVRDRHGLHDLPERAASMRPLQHILRDRRAAARTSRRSRRPAARRSRGPTRRSSSPT